MRRGERVRDKTPNRAKPTYFLLIFSVIVHCFCVTGMGTGMAPSWDSELPSNSGTQSTPSFQTHSFAPVATSALTAKIYHTYHSVNVDLTLLFGLWGSWLFLSSLPKEVTRNNCKTWRACSELPSSVPLAGGQCCHHPNEKESQAWCCNLTSQRRRRRRRTTESRVQPGLYICSEF